MGAPAERRNGGGRNSIKKILNGCVLHERYTTPSGYAGESFNIFDAARGVWHQTWVDSSGAVLDLNGGWADGRMVMSGDRKGPQGNPMTDRITWTPNDDGTVRQHWEASTDGGSTWIAGRQQKETVLSRLCCRALIARNSVPLDARAVVRVERDAPCLHSDVGMHTWCGHATVMVLVSSALGRT